MLNEERVILMTKMASFEEKEGKKSVSVGSYFKGDYISLQVIKSIIHATIAYAIVLALYIFYDFELFMQDIYKMDLLEFGKNMIFSYLISAGIYAFISYLIYSFRYSRARKNLKCYYNNLKKMSRYYQLESEKDRQSPKGTTL